MRIVILYSGGLDSLIMSRYAELTQPNAEVIKVYFDIGQEYAHKEIAQLTSDVIVKKIEWNPTPVAKEGNTAGAIMIPGRNLVFAILAASMFTPDQVWLGALSGEDNAGATDKNEKFRQLTNDTLEYVLSPYCNTKLVFPFIEADMGKLDITRWALENGIPAQTILDSSSCMDGTLQKCGKCIVCGRRWGIFRQLGISETYTTHPLQSASIREHIKAVLTDDGNHYNNKRKAEFGNLTLDGDNIIEG